MAPAKILSKRTRPRRFPSSIRGQLDLNLEPAKSMTLPDKIPIGVHTLFIGISPGMKSARIGHYYAGASNTFWKLFHASGLWPRAITTNEDDEITRAGFGLTDACARATPGLADLTKSDFAESKNRVLKRVRSYHPRTVVFVSKGSARAYLENPQASLEYGLQDWKIEDSSVFVVPSTSGASLGHSSYLHKLKWFKELKQHIESTKGRHAARTPSSG
jgi:double-stranded uracil-DNA glycosylase